MEHVVQYRIKIIDDATGVQRRVNALNQQSQAGFKNLGQKIDQVNAPTRRLLGNMRTLGNEGVRAPGAMMAGFGKLKNFLSGPMVAAVGGAFAIGKVVQFGGEVVDTLSKFERFEAVLSNTLGSNSAAKLVMREITNFAARTPFEVDQLTDSYVRLANQGFTPTMDQMTALGDLASSTGKDISMLSEGILDAMVGENERLKEFGIKAEQSGKKTIFTFKGVRTEVDRNASSIRDYLVSLGKVQGVQGAMAKISETTGGKTSNLSDKITQLKLVLGQGLKPVIDGVIDFVGKLTDRFSKNAEWLKNNEALVKRFTTNALQGLWNMVEHIGRGINMMIGFWEKNGETIKKYWSVIAKILPPIIGFILKLGLVVMKVYSVFYTFLLKTGQWFYNLGKRIGDFFIYLRDKYIAFKDWWEDNFFLSKWLSSLTDTIIPGIKSAWQGFVDWIVDVTKVILLPFQPLFDLIAHLDRKSQQHAQEKRRQESTDALNRIGTRAGLYHGQGRFSASDANSQGTGNERADRWRQFGLTKKEDDESAAGILGGSSGSPAGAGSGKTISQRATEVKGVQSGDIKHITINIQKLVESLNVTSQKLSMSESEIKAAMTRILLGAVNDIQHSN